MLQDIRIRQRDYLIKIAQILTQELELEPLLWQVIQMAVDLVGGESGFVALYNENNGWQIQTQLNLSDAELKYIETYLSGMAQAVQVADLARFVYNAVLNGGAFLETNCCVSADPGAALLRCLFPCRNR